MTTRVAWVTNIPTPYRNHRYERMAAIFPGLGLDVEVHYMAGKEHRRPWSYRSAELRYPNRIHGGVELHQVSDAFHVNPGLLWELARDPRDVLVVGGWIAPSAMAAPFVTGRRPLRLLESESNLDSSRFGRGPARWLKASIIRRYDGFIGPSVRSLELLTRLAPSAAGRPFLEFPNLIDPAVFGEGVRRERSRRDELRAELGVDAGTALWVCPARLETFKGVHLLLPLLEGITGIQLVVCGEGSLRPAFERTIAEGRLPVRLLGQKAEAEMVRLYAAADLFVLPSLSDPSPLSPIEACASGLPLLVSRRIGNFDDVVEPGVNGWAFDVDDPESNRETIRRIAATSRAELAAMGGRSRERYDRRFDSDACVTRVGEGIRDLHERRRRGGGRIF